MRVPAIAAFFALLVVPFLSYNVRATSPASVFNIRDFGAHAPHGNGPLVEGEHDADDKTLNASIGINHLGNATMDPDGQPDLLIDNATLLAAVDRIIPRDDFPSASEAGVIDYIHRILSGDLEHVSRAFAQSMRDLDAEALARKGRSFLSLTPEDQDQLLAAVERGDVTARWATSPADFFRLLVELTAEGYYSDPSTGGNRDMISWAMVGYDPKAQAPSPVI